MSFEEVAKEVIKNSIRSAICIDDKYASAYSSDSDSDLIFDEPRELYNSFREKGQCDLDIFQFKSLEESWKKEYMMPNKDLMILDWELDPIAEPKYKDTLDILTDVIESNQIPFVVIYTNTVDLEIVSRILLSQFSFVDKDFEIQPIIEALDKNISKMPHGDLDIDFELFLEGTEILKLFFDYLFFYDQKQETKDSILKKIKDSMGLQEKIGERAICSAIARSLKAIVPESKDYLTTLAFIALSQEYSPEKCFDIKRVESNEPILKINNTTVLIYHKSDNGKGVKPEDLFEVFSKAIIAHPHNYLSLLSLELKDQLRKEFSIIGTRFSEVDENAFFYHMGSFKKKGGFYKRRIYDFVINSWIQDLNAQTLDGQSEVIEVLDEVLKGSEDPPAELDEPLKKSLIKYSAFLSTSYLKPNDKKLKFGDIFKNKEKEEYFLCITPHCDCVLPDEKIKNNFYFTKGTIVTSKQNTNKADKIDYIKLAIDNAEKKNYSFLDVDNNAICIDWSCKPFTAFISNNNTEDLSFSYLDKKLSLIYITTLKENFAQRLSNESFGYGYRVGINLPHTVSN